VALSRAVFCWCHRACDLRPTRTGRTSEMGRHGVALVAYSILIDIFAASYLKFFPIAPTAIGRTVAFVVVSALLIPALVGWFVVNVREFLAEKGLVLSAMPTAWDEFFHRIGGPGRARDNAQGRPPRRRLLGGKTGGIFVPG
jgi:hypothetical protein